MKKLIFILAMFFGLLANSQIDLGVDAGFSGIWATGKVIYAIEDVAIVGGSYGYNIVNPYIDHRIDACIGYKPNEFAQIEADLGVMLTSKSNPYYAEVLDETSIFHADLSLKINTKFNMYYSIGIAWPGFCKIGLGFRLRPWDKLTVWDKQADW